jgi:hypothetical protein
MPPDLAPLLAVLSMGVFVLVGMKIWLKHKIDRQRLEGSEEVDRLAEVIDSLHDQIQLVREDLGDLQERVDFAERLLTRGEDEAGSRQEVPAPE